MANKQKSIQTIILTLSFVLISLILISNVSAYKSLCLTKGQVIPSKQKPMFTCTHDLCMMCVTDNNYPTAPGYCNDISTGCSILTPGDGGTIDTTPPVITIRSPVDNNVYNGRQVLFDLSTNELSSLYYIDNVNGRGQWKAISNNPVSTYKSSLSFADGLNDITIKAVDKSGNPTTIIKKFYVDSKKPTIKSTGPAKGFSSGFFMLQFTEQNPKTITLNYGNSAVGMRTAVLNTNTNCALIKGIYNCSISVNVNDYNNQEIQYYFSVEDIANTKVQSKYTSLLVDMSAPVINNPTTMFQAVGKYGYFNISITEPNFKSVTYMDNLDKRPKWSSVCTSLKNGVCYKKITFLKGNHNIDIQILDAAGNKIIKSFEFSVL